MYLSPGLGWPSLHELSQAGTLEPRGVDVVGAQDVGARDIGARDIGARDIGARDIGARDLGAPRGVSRPDYSKLAGRQPGRKPQAGPHAPGRDLSPPPSQGRSSKGKGGGGGGGGELSRVIIRVLYRVHPASKPSPEPINSLGYGTVVLYRTDQLKP